MEEDWASGIATCMKSGTSMHIILPASIVKYLGIEDRDVIKIKAIKTGEKRERRYVGVKNFKKSNPQLRESNDTNIVPKT